MLQPHDTKLFILDAEAQSRKSDVSHVETNSENTKKEVDMNGENNCVDNSPAMSIDNESTTGTSDDESEGIVFDGRSVWPNRATRENWVNSIQDCETISAVAFPFDKFIDQLMLCNIFQNKTKTTLSKSVARASRAFRAKRRGRVQDEGIDTEDVCTVCGEPGELILCDGRNCGFQTHLKCVFLKRVPLGDYFCPSCSTNSETESEDDNIYHAKPSSRSTRASKRARLS